MKSKDRKNRILLALACFVVVSITVLGLVVFNFLLFKPAVRAFSGDYNRTDVSLSVDDWNFLDEDFIGKDGDTMTGGLNMDSISLTGIVTDSNDSGSLASVGFVNDRVNSALGGTTYVNWGRGDCNRSNGGNDTLLYDGFALGTVYTENSGGYNGICMQVGDAGPDNNNIWNGADNLVPGMSTGQGFLPDYPAQRFNPAFTYIKCAVCYRNRSACYINYGTESCGAGPFTTEAYDGIMAAGIFEGHAMTRNRKCINRNFDNSAGQPDPRRWGAPWYNTHLESNFDLTQYTPLTVVKCAVCCN